VADTIGNSAGTAPIGRFRGLADSLGRARKAHLAREMLNVEQMPSAATARRRPRPGSVAPNDGRRRLARLWRLL
jgi:hypothetical protein